MGEDVWVELACDSDKLEVGNCKYLLPSQLQTCKFSTKRFAQLVVVLTDQPGNSGPSSTTTINSFDRPSFFRSSRTVEVNKRTVRQSSGYLRSRNTDGPRISFVVDSVGRAQVVGEAGRVGDSGWRLGVSDVSSQRPFVGTVIIEDGVSCFL
jgi:hypothetical protein